MTTATTSTLEAVGGDPAPGDPEAFFELARALAATATAAGGARATLGRLSQGADDSIWRGEAADAFRTKLETLPGQLQKLDESYTTAAEGLGVYARVLRELQAEAAPALGDARGAEDDQRFSEAQRDQAQSVDPVAPTTAQDDAIDQARQRLARSRAQIERIRDDRESAEHTLTGRLDDAHEQGIKNESWGGLRSFLRKVGEVADIIGLVLLVIAVVVIVTVAIVTTGGFALAAGLAAAAPLLQAGAVVGAIGFGSRAARFGLGDGVSFKALAFEGLLMALPFIGNKVGRAVGGGKLLGATDDVSIPSGSRATASAPSAPMAGSIRHVNPGGATAVGRSQNCLNCALATDSVLAGRPAVALASSGPQSIAVLERSVGRTFGGPTTAGLIERDIVAAGPGARGIVFGHRGPGRVGHVFNVVNQKGVVRFLDGQTGGAADVTGFMQLRLLRTN